ncbi:hypothetical protein [Fibrobacter sp.]|jgi:hypothetical protein|uniref:hypothetical protein n=1 Tax=Fibrobacter sp. TaxID=35828 RepID=UPI003867180F
MTDITDRLRRKHNAPETLRLKEQVEDFIKRCSIDSETQYHLKNNLSVKIDLPYYGESKGKRPKPPFDHLKIVLDFCKYLIQYNHREFTELLLGKLTVQQNQSLRKIAKRRKDKKKLSSKEGIWEHVIPANVVKNKLIEIIGGKLGLDDKLKEIERILTVFKKAGQLHITKDDDKKLSESDYTDAMPLDWDWSEEKIFSRYIEAGINLAKYMDI